MRLWDTRRGKQTSMATATGDLINVGWSPNGSHLVTGSEDNVLTFIDIRTMKTMKATKFVYEVRPHVVRSAPSPSPHRGRA